MTPQEFVAVARSFKNTPFHQNARCPGVGLDCLGVVVCASKKCGITHEDITAYSMIPNDTLQPELERQMIRVNRNKAQPADILLIRFRGQPHHVAVFTGDGIIHAHAGARKCVEQPMVKYWWANTVAVYRFREFMT